MFHLIKFQIQDEVRQLLCFLTRDNIETTENLCSLITSRVLKSLNDCIFSHYYEAGIRHEISLLASLMEIQDNLWEVRFKYIIKMFLKACKDSYSSVVMESIILPSLNIWYNLLQQKDRTDKQIVSTFIVLFIFEFFYVFYFFYSSREYFCKHS